LGKGDAAKQAAAAAANNQTTAVGDETSAAESTQQFNVIPDELVELFRRLQDDIFDGVCV